MSYDYMLAKGSAAGGIEGFAEAAATGTVGSIEKVKASISRLFPSVRWEQHIAKLPDGTDGPHWRGLQGPPEFHLMVEADGAVRVVTMSRCERGEVENVARELGLVALDEQSMEVFGA